MSFEQKLSEIDDLQERINSYGVLSSDLLKKINYKFRLEWNYTSNSMEGNSLTKSETRSVMIGNITVDGKPIKDVLEVKGHDEVITTIMRTGKGELNISEKRIKEIHTGIMHEEDPAKKVQIGQWKKEPNYLFNYKNERFDFVAPRDVPDRMHVLVNWINSEKEKIARGQKDALHPVLLALRFNLEYVTIHPFYDGNGRTSRILTNLILIAYGYPPLYIRENERNAYYQYLGDIQGYGGAPDVFYDYMAGLIIRSQQLVLDAINGIDIEEPDDIEKEIILWKKSLEIKNSPVPRSDSNCQEIYKQTVVPLFEKIKEKFSVFEDLFNKCLYKIAINGQIQNDLQAANLYMLRTSHLLHSSSESTYSLFNQIEINVNLHEFQKNDVDVFSISANVIFVFNDYKWVTIVNSKLYSTRPYHQQLPNDELDAICRELLREIFGVIKRNINGNQE